MYEAPTTACVHVRLLPQQQPVTQLFLLRVLTAVLCPCYINHNPTNQIGALKSCTVAVCKYEEKLLDAFV